MKLSLANMPKGISAEEALVTLQSETQCGTNCGSCKPELKQIIANFLKIEVAA
jgi:assimilatory nitrate reductase catalytic subunit